MKADEIRIINDDNSADKLLADAAVLRKNSEHQLVEVEKLRDDVRKKNDKN